MESTIMHKQLGVIRVIVLSYLFVLLPLSVIAQEIVPTQGCRRGTPKPHSTEAIHRSTAQVRQPGGDFYKGDRHQLTVLVSFSDRTFKDDEAATIEQWNNIFNTVGYTEDSFHGSVHDYFYDQSYGQFNVTFDLQYVALSSGHAKYGSTSADDENSQFLVQDIMDVLQQRPIDWSLYDWNGDGYVNQLLIIYAGKGSSYGNFGGGNNAIWPHQWWLSEHIDPTTGAYCTPRTVTNGDGKKYSVDCYCALQELSSNNSYGTFGTICHEYSHCFGFPDFYVGGTSYVRYWDLMDYGNYSSGGFCPTAYSAHERWLMGWLTPTELTEAATIADMPALSEEGTAYLIRNDGYADEYYVIENRQNTGWDTSLPSSGIVVFHIDYDPSIWVSVETAPNWGSRKRYTIIPANDNSSTTTSSNWPYPYATNNQLTNTSAPAATLNNRNIDGSFLMSKPLTNMNVTNGLASFDFMGGTSSISAIHTADHPQHGTHTYNLAGQRVNETYRGLVIINGRKVLR
ncbi:MAG: M6 family metalloprotease domain-containing protein [Prevotella sp.]|nr:M6 family metalloprotease domain-containing protein [Prevotella sp.]